jgi:hypothetical protein
VSISANFVSILAIVGSFFSALELRFLCFFDRFARGKFFDAERLFKIRRVKQRIFQEFLGFVEDRQALFFGDSIAGGGSGWVAVAPIDARSQDASNGGGIIVWVAVSIEKRLKMWIFGKKKKKKKKKKKGKSAKKGAKKRKYRRFVFRHSDFVVDFLAFPVEFGLSFLVARQFGAVFKRKKAHPRAQIVQNVQFSRLGTRKIGLSADFDAFRWRFLMGKRWILSANEHLDEILY